MKTRCYCILCPKHPLYAKRKELPVVTGFEVGRTIWKPEEIAAGVDVECLEPVSDAFSELDINPDDHEFPVTAYGDGCSITGFDGRGFTITANCENEEFEKVYNQFTKGE